MELIQPFRFQGYQLYCDNLHSIPGLFVELHDEGIYATGTLWTDRKGVPKQIQQMKMALNKIDVSRGTGFYWREKDLKVVYCGWRDSKCVVMLS